MTDSLRPPPAISNGPNDDPSPDRLVGRSIRRAREKVGLTQKELSDRLTQSGWEIDSTAVTRIEKGTRAVRVNQLYLIAAVLETSPTRLMQSESEQIGDLYETCVEFVWRVASDAHILAGSIELLHHALTTVDGYEQDPNPRVPLTSSADLLPHLLGVASNRVAERKPMEVLDRNLDRAEERADGIRQILAALTKDAVSTELSRQKQRGAADHHVGEETP